MGGRGASSGIAKNGKKYGTEYRTVLQDGDIKFVKKNEGLATAPMETMTQGRIYVTVNAQDKLKNITLYDEDGKRSSQIDLGGHYHRVEGKKRYVHAHFGYEHEERGGTKNITSKEWQLIRRVKKAWYNKPDRR